VLSESSLKLLFGELAPQVVNFHGDYFSTFTPEDQKLACCFMENGRNGDEIAKYVLLMMLADLEMSPSKFLLVLHIFKCGSVFFSLPNSVQMQGKILFAVSHSGYTASSP